MPNGLPVAAGPWLLDTVAHWNHYTGGALPEYLGNINTTQAQQVDVSILNGVDVSGMKGAEFLLGYGTTDQEMLANGCYRKVYVVQDEPAAPTL